VAQRILAETISTESAMAGCQSDFQPKLFYQGLNLEQKAR
jgi:hypothetical protein